MSRAFPRNRDEFLARLPPYVDIRDHRPTTRPTALPTRLGDRFHIPITPGWLVSVPDVLGLESQYSEPITPAEVRNIALRRMHARVERRLYHAANQPMVAEKWLPDGTVLYSAP